MLSSLLLALFASGAALAGPSPAADHGSKCNPSKDTLKVPSALATPDGPPHFIAVAAGVQNYTCTKGAYT